MHNSMIKLSWDDVPHWCPTYCEIALKANLYRTARMKQTGVWVQIRAHTREGRWYVQDHCGRIFSVDTLDLCDFGL